MLLTDSFASDVRDHSLALYGPLLLLSMPGLIIATSGCVSTQQWAIVEVTEVDGIRIHEAEQTYYLAGGDPDWQVLGWGKPGQPPVRWILDPYGYTRPRNKDHPVWPAVKSGDVSRGGLLAMARRIRYGEYYVGVTEVRRLSDGELVSRVENHPLAVGWSNNGDTLAILEIGEKGLKDDPVYLSLWKEGSGRVVQWELAFDPFASNQRSSAADNVFTISWSADDLHLVVSTRSIPLNAMKPKSIVISVTDGPLCSYGASDAYFVGSDSFLANVDGQWDKVRLMRVSKNGVVRAKPVRGQLFIAGSDPMSGTYVAWHPPPLWPPKAFSLPLAFHDLTGRLPVKKTGFSIGSSLCLMRADRLRSMLCEGESRHP